MPRILIPGENDVKTLYPSLVLDWDYDNNERKSEDYLPGSHDKINWKCHVCGQKWEAVLSSRVNGRGCPYCSGNRPIKGKNDLKTMYPDVAKEWNYMLNNGLSPEDVSYGSSKKVWWTCPNKHNYDQSINKRTLRGSGCPICSGHRIIAGINDFGTLYPTVAAEWHPTKNGDKKPEMFSGKSGFRAWWKCKYEHEWQATIHDRSSGTGCPYCKNRFSTSFAEQAIYFYVRKVCPDAINRYKGLFDNNMELDIYIPSRKVAIEFDGSNWHNTRTAHEREIYKYKICRENSIYLIRVKEYTKEKWTDVADVIYYLPKRDKGELQNITQGIVDTLDPESNPWTKKYLDRCHSKIEVDLVKDNAAILSYLKSVSNSIAELRPDLIDEWHPTKNGGLKPEYFGINSNERAWWKCKNCDHEWCTTIIHRAGKRRSGCPECAKAKSGKTFTKVMIEARGSLLDNNLLLCEEWNSERNGVTPDKVMANNNTRYWWKCKKCSFEWQCTPNNRNNKGSGCPHCSGRVPMTGVDDLKTVYPKIAEWWYYSRNGEKRPEQFLPHSSKRVWWHCPLCKCEWESTISERVKRIGYCTKCKGYL